tara:strand:- start:999 stop:1895 length:897 start_codon:yes stop_codon:yes gene_type:complete
MKFSNLKLVICGANGFTGRVLCQELIDNNFSFTAILRPGNDPFWMNERNISYEFADLENAFDLEDKIIGHDVLISVASIAFGNVPSILKACKNANINRVIFTSSTAIFTKLNAKSKEARFAAEKIIIESEFIWTIIRPTMIYGTPDDRNLIRLIKWIDKNPFLPIFGTGTYLQQPIYVYDLAKTFINIIENKKTFNMTFNVSGLKPITYKEMILTIKKELKKKCIEIYLPANFFIFILKFMEKLKIKFPIKAEQLERLNEDKSFSNESAKNAFNFKSITFKEGIRSEIKKYKIKNKFL